MIILRWLYELRLLRRQHEILTLIDTFLGGGSDICYVGVSLTERWALVNDVVFDEHLLARNFWRGDVVVVYDRRRHLAVAGQLAQQLLLQLLIVRVVIVFGRHDFARYVAGC